MRLLVLSDVHAHLEPLERVLAHADGRGWDELLFLGDAVGYGREASDVVRRLAKLPLRAGLRGNHEEMLDAIRDGRSPYAADSITRVLTDNLAELGEEELAYLDALENVYLDGDWGAVHGALREPYEYLISVPVARANAVHMERDVYFVGHTHVPVALMETAPGRWQLRPFTGAEGRVRIPEGARAFLNPGSVSLPRDRGPAGCYGLYDEELREFTVFRLG